MTLKAQRMAGWLTAATLAMTSGAAMAATNLVTNGDFETGSFNGWVRSGAADFTDIDCFGGCFGNFALDSGTQFAMGYVSQNLATLAGTVYAFELWFQSDGEVPNRLTVDIGGTNFYTASDVAAQVFTRVGFQFTASSNLTQIRLGFRSDPGFVQIDNVSVTAAVPEPGTAAFMALGLAALAQRCMARRAIARRSSGSASSG